MNSLNKEEIERKTFSKYKKGNEKEIKKNSN